MTSRPPPPGFEPRLNASAQKEAEELLRNCYKEMKYWNVEDTVTASMCLDYARPRFIYLREVLPESVFNSAARAFISGPEAGGEMIVAREYGFGPVYGADIVPGFVEVAQRRFEGLEAFDCCLYDGVKIPHPDGFFDIVLSGHVIEHTADPRGYLWELLRVLKVGGYLFLEYPTRYHHTELHTGLPSLEWAPAPLRNAGLRFLSSRFSPYKAEARRRYYTILDTRLRQISLPRIRYWIARSGSRMTLVDAAKAIPGIIRTVFQKVG